MPEEQPMSAATITAPATDSQESILTREAVDFVAGLARSFAPCRQELLQARRGGISFTSPEGKRYEVSAHPAVLKVRPRGWHLEEKHFLVEGKPVSASLFDFGLFFFHNVQALIAKGTGPYFYLPKMESHLEAR